MLAWTNANGGDTNGGVSTAEDELITHYVRVRSSGTRHVSITPDNNVWVSGSVEKAWDLVEGATGRIIRQEPSVGWGGYGGLITPDGVIWSTRPLMRWDTRFALPGQQGITWRPYDYDSYGTGVDSQGNVWVTELGSKLRKFDPQGNCLGAFPHGGRYAQGVAVDMRDDVWVAHSLLGARTVGHLKNDGTWLGNIEVGNGPTGMSVDMYGKIWTTNYHSGTVVRIDPTTGPLGLDGVTPVGAVDLVTQYLGGNLYNYSDMTGSTRQHFGRPASWTIVFDSTLPQAAWGPVSWTASVCNDSRIYVFASVSNDGVSYSTPQTLTLDNRTPSGLGRYLKAEVLFIPGSEGLSPVLYDLTVGTAGYADPPFSDAWSLSAGEEKEIEWPSAGRLQGEICHSGGYASNNDVQAAWTLVSGPAPVEIDCPTTISTIARFGGLGDYVMRLTVTRDGQTQWADVTYHLIPVNRSPWVDLGPDRAVPETGIDYPFTATVWDDGLPVTCPLTLRWSKRFGPGTVTFADPTTATTYISFSAPGFIASNSPPAIASTPTPTHWKSARRPSARSKIRPTCLRGGRLTPS